jgi:hypothetical protein
MKVVHHPEDAVKPYAAEWRCIDTRGCRERQAATGFGVKP